MDGRLARRTFVVRIGAALAAVGAAGAFGPAARAEGIDTAKFKEGCQSGGHSYVENRDGSFQCNLRDGAEIKCTSTKGPCHYVPRPALAVGPGTGTWTPPVAEFGHAVALAEDLQLGITLVPQPAAGGKRKRRRRR
jgi:hypothetical protein